MSKDSKLSSSIGLFLITDQQHLSSLRLLVEKIHKSFSIDPVPNWRLEHRSLVSKPESSPDKNSPRWQHVLHLSHVRGKVFVAIEPSQETSKPKEPICLVTIPDSQKDSYNTLLATKMPLLWTPKSTIGISNGIMFLLSDCTIRLGEVRAAGSNQGVRAILVSIEMLSNPAANGTMAKNESDLIKDEIKKLWKTINPGMEAKEAWGFGGETDVIRAWCEILKLR